MMSFFKKEDKERKKKQISNTSSNYLQENVSNSDLFNLNEQENQMSSSNQQLSSSSKSSIESTNTNNNSLNINQPPIVPPKPKKGILKTMSKFGIGPSISLPNQPSSTSSGGASSTPKLIPKLAASVFQPHQPVQKSIESSIPTYSKRNSQFLNEIATTQSSTTTNSSTFTLPKLKSIPIYLTPETSSQNDSIIESYLFRSINIPVSLIHKIELTHPKDFIPSSINPSDLNNFKGIPILVDSVDSSFSFLPGDQLISLNDEYILEKTLNEVKHNLNMIKNLSNLNESVKLSVRTSLECSDIVLRDLHKNIPISDKLKRKLPNLVFNSTNSSSTGSTSSLTSSNPTSPTQSVEDSDLNQVWLLHANGYSSARIFAKVIHKNSNTSLDSLNSNGGQTVRFKVRLDNGTLIEVNEENLEKANPSQFDYCDDLSKLRFINETSLIHCLRQRYITLKLNQTLIGNQNLLILKPKENLIHLNRIEPLNNDRLISLFKSFKQYESPPAHIYSYTQSVYKSMLSNRQDQSIILMGHSSSGKSSNSKFILNYLFKVANNSTNNSTTSSFTSVFNETKLNAMYCLINAFCCVKTEKNPINANRFLNIFLLEFNHSGQLLSLLLQLITFDQTRLIYQPVNESNYLIFYYLIFGSNQIIKNDLNLNSDLFSFETQTDTSTTTGNLFFHSEKFLNEQQDTNFLYKNLFEQTLDSFKILNFEEYEIKSVLAILACILHLGRAGAVKSQTAGQRGQFHNINEAQKAAQLLGISYNQLNDYVFTFISSSNSNSTPNRSKYSHLSNNGSTRISPESNASLAQTATPLECLQGFCLGLYQECLNLIVNCINRSFKQTFQTQAISNSMLIVDPPGFQSNSSKLSSYSDLICNYLCERLQLMFFQINFINPIEKCAQEGLDIDLVEHIPESPSSIVNWFDKPPPPNSILNRTNLGTNSNELSNCGLLWLLEEQINNEIKNSKSFMQRLNESDTKQNFISINSNNFTIYHLFGQFPVEYNLETWLDLYNREFLTQRNALTCLQESKKEFISSAFYQSVAMSNAAATLTNSGLTSSSLNSLENSGASSLKRQASVRKMLTLSKRKTFTINFKLQIDSLFDSMRKTKCNFVFCLLPNKLDTNDLEIPIVRSQLKAYQVLATCRIYRQGYPEYLNLEEFVRRFSLFMPASDHANREHLTHKQLSQSLIKTFDLDSSLFKIGNTQIFFKAGILTKLEDQRDEKVNDLIVKLQANCRQYLAKKSFEKKKIQDSAIRCVQKNIRIWFALKKWRWWRLYTNLMPIVNVQNHEHLLNQLKNELDDFKKKNERLLNEKNELKLLNNQLENKLMNLQTEYVEEHAANAGTIDLLEVETSERMRLEKELNELRPLYNETAKKLETIETEMLELRLYNTKKSIEQELEKDDIDGLSNLSTTTATATTTATNNQTNQRINTNQIENLKRENEMLKRQLKQEKENIQMFNLNERNFFEMKLKEKDAELLEIEKQSAMHKRKYQKMCEEMQDLERMCDESKVRNRELEKLQSKFDSEMQNLKAKYESEKELREKCERERDSAKYEIFSLKSELDTQKLETVYHLEKCERLERDLKEYESAVSTNSAGTNNNSIPTDQFLKMKSQIRDLEAKLRDQEEELDEQTFTIQQLEQNKLKLEMQLEKEKQKWTREIAEKESEMDDLRFHTQKKIKAIEMQLEEESEISSSLQREKRELERKLREIASGSGSKKSYLNGNSEINSNESLNDYIIKLKRQMLKYKTLAFDAQTQLEKLKENIPKQSILKALKAQLEDSEITKANALKTKQLLQVEIENLQQQLDEAISHKQNLEEQNLHLNRELNNLKSELEEQERDSDEILKKYQIHIQNYTLDSHRFIDLSNQIDILTIENRILKEKIREMEEKISYYETAWVDRTMLNKLENKTRELESKLEFETTHKSKIQNQLDRVKQQYENSLSEIELILAREKKSEDTLRRAQRNNKEIMEEFGDLKKKVIDLDETKKRLEQQNEILERELESSKSEVKINLTRLEAFQNAFNSMNNEVDEDEDDNEVDEDNDEENDEYEIDYDMQDELDRNESNKSLKFLNSSMSRASTKSNDYS